MGNQGCAQTTINELREELEDLRSEVAELREILHQKHRSRSPSPNPGPRRLYIDKEEEEANEVCIHRAGTLQTSL